MLGILNGVFIDVELDVCEPIDVIDNDSFDMVIDKATLDSVLCHPRPQDRIIQMMDVRISPITPL